MERAGATEGEQRVVTWILHALDRDHPDRTRQMVGSDRDDAGRHQQLERATS